MLSLVSNLLTHVNINYFQFFMTSTNHLTAILLWKLVESFQTFLKPLTEFSMKGCHIKLSHLEYLEQVISEGSFKWLVLILGRGFSWGSSGICFGSFVFLCILTISAAGYHLQPNFFLMTHPFSQWSMMSHNLPIN